MKSVVLVCVFVLIVHLCSDYAQAAPHNSDEDEDSSESDEVATSVETKPEPTPEPSTIGPDPSWKQVQSHEVKSKEDEVKSKEDEVKSTEDEVANSSEEAQVKDLDESNEDDDTVKHPKTESLCPARPEEITNIEAECAKEYAQWKEMRARKIEQAQVTTSACDPPCESTVGDQLVTLVEVVDAAGVTDPSNTAQLNLWEQYTTTDDTMTTTDDDVAMTTDMPETTTTVATTMAPTTTTMLTTTRPIRRNSKHKRSTKKIIKKRSCYPATCILRKLNLLDNMGQPSIDRIQSFAVNMTVDDSTNLEEKAVGCVKEINEAMIDASGDIGKKVGCVAQKVITCLNKGLSCPIMQVPQ